MKNKIVSMLLMAVLLLVGSCSDFLEFTPKGVLPPATALLSPEEMSTAAYAALGNDFWDQSITSMWVYGSVRSDDAYKGGGSVQDQINIHFMEVYNLTQADMSSYLPFTWTNLYESISRANIALQALNAADVATFPNKTLRTAEMRFLRGHAHFLAKTLWKYIPYIDETLTREDILKVSNRELTSDQMWDKIAADFQFAIDNLPEIQSQKGRANKLSATAYLAKVRLYQAYQQDETHSVTSISPARLNEVVTLTQAVISSGKYALQPDFAENFLWGFDNGPESIFAVQYSVNDGTAIGRLGMSTSLNYSLAPQYGCCWFHLPSHNMVNAFKTDPTTGLPLFDTFNNVMLTDADLTPTGATVDPRIDHTVGIAGHPFKYNPKILYAHSWERVPQLYIGFGNMKEQQAADCPCFRKIGPFYGSAKNLDFIRYADVLLWQAEAYIRLGQEALALPLINQVRARAANSTGRTKKEDGTPPSKYLASQYQDGVNIVWNNANAWKALMYERRMEFAMEGHRWFDLVRWGVADQVLNDYLAVEKTRKSFLSAAAFTKGRDEYYPIPFREINFTKGLYVQNPGY